MQSRPLQKRLPAWSCRILVVLVEVAKKMSTTDDEDHDAHGSADDDRFLAPVAVF